MTGTLGLQRKNMNFAGKSKINSGLFWILSIGIFIPMMVIFVFVAKNFVPGWHPFSFLSSFSKSKKHTFVENFNKKTSRKIEETGKMSQSSNKNWWVDSGGWMEISSGTGKTIEGDLSADNKWAKLYKESNSKDTDNGAHPQNIFRLVTRDKWQNFRQQAFFRINKINLSASDNRNESNGFLLFNRYQDGDDLYYAGLRVDGYAVIKKKIKSDYHTLASEKVYKGGDYNRDTNPNLLPVGQWIGLKSVVETNSSGDVDITLYYKKGRNTKGWKQIAHCVDKGQKGDQITDPGYGGIRTDFMDVEFDKYKITDL